MEDMQDPCIQLEHPSNHSRNKLQLNLAQALNFRDLEEYLWNRIALFHLIPLHYLSQIQPLELLATSGDRTQENQEHCLPSVHLASVKASCLESLFQRKSAFWWYVASMSEQWSMVSNYVIHILMLAEPNNLQRRVTVHREREREEKDQKISETSRRNPPAVSFHQAASVASVSEHK